ncbi:universal stress protein [Desulfofalx alkaliphila]|uniref:universal stress protein n=1 Tax=Desulfofalx alkaliphila TaxID=105483 RepID=UPI00068DB9F9|nr:universal stress protein [Desulfofalx alkaliphila]
MGLGKKRIKINTEVLIGDPADSICRFSKGGYELIVMGSRALGELKGFFMGSVSKRVVRPARCPVLIYR